MKILVLAPHPFFQTRGTPIAVKLILETLATGGHQLKVLTYHEGEDPVIPGCVVHRIPKIKWVKNIKLGFSWKKLVCDLSMFWEGFKIVRQERFDVIHAVEESVFLAYFFKKFFHIPYIYDMDSLLSEQIIEKYSILNPIRAIFETFERIAIKESIGAIAVCKHIEETVRRIDSQKLILRLEDVPNSAQEIGEYIEPLRDTYGIKGSIVMYVGNLEHYQGIDLLQDSFKKVLTALPFVNLVIIGGSSKDILLYRKRAKMMGIQERMYFIGPKPLSYLYGYFKQADVLVSPRIKGYNTPMKIFSYLDSGIAILATKLPTHTQILDENIAFLVLPEPEYMANGLLTLLRNSQMREELAKNAKERVRKEYSYDIFRKKLSKFYGTINGYKEEFVDLTYNLKEEVGQI